MKEDIINSYRRLSLGKYMDILAISRDESLEEIERQIKIICILSDKTEDEISDMPIEDYKAMVIESSFLGHQFEPDKRLANTYTIGAFTLVPVLDFRKVTTAQYIDFQSFHKAGFETHLAEIISCLLVPKGKRYSQDYDIIELQSAIRENLSVADALTLYAFFLLSSRQSIKDMITYLRTEAEKVKDKNRKELLMKQISQQEILLRTDGVGLPM